MNPIVRFFIAICMFSGACAAQYTCAQNCATGGWQAFGDSIPTAIDYESSDGSSGSYAPLAGCGQINQSPSWNPNVVTNCSSECGYFSPNQFANSPIPLNDLTLFFGAAGTKQPQDFGVNANLGARGSLNYSAALFPESGIGYQMGTAVSTFGNAVQVFEILGESTGRTQSFTTLGFFQRRPGGFFWGGVYDYQYTESFDNFSLGQWRLRAGWEIRPDIEFGATVNLSSRKDVANFNGTDNVELEPVEQLHVFVRKYWQTGASTTFWVGVADGHSEENAVTGTLPPKSNQILFGADIHAPLNQWLAIYGETNFVMPADTGAVDAFLGIEISPQRRALNPRANPYRPLFRVASNPSFTVDLNRQ